MHASAVPPIRAGSKTASRETGRNPYRNIRPKHEPHTLSAKMPDSTIVVPEPGRRYTFEP